VPDAPSDALWAEAEHRLRDHLRILGELQPARSGWDADRGARRDASADACRVRPLAASPDEDAGKSVCHAPA